MSRLPLFPHLTQSRETKGNSHDLFNPTMAPAGGNTSVVVGER